MTLTQIWVADPPNRAGFAIEILPPGFNTKGSPCVLCGGALDFYWICTRCDADHFPAVQRLIKLKTK